jgi:catalase (peroxidase I)
MESESKCPFSGDTRKHTGDLTGPNSQLRAFAEIYACTDSEIATNGREREWENDFATSYSNDANVCRKLLTMLA